jgi:hypothetical protein
VLVAERVVASRAVPVVERLVVEVASSQFRLKKSSDLPLRQSALSTESQNQACEWNTRFTRSRA